MESRKSYIVTMGVSILCLVVIVFTTTYAYFTPQIVGEGELINVISGKIKLKISETKITASNLAPILDSTKDTKAQKNQFTISRTDDSNLNACYSLYLVVDNIGSSLQNKYFKYELVYGSDVKNDIVVDNDEEVGIEDDLEVGTDTDVHVIFGDFSSLEFNDNGTATIGLLVNQEISSKNPKNNYILRIWLSYDSDDDQTSLLTGEPSTRVFNAHILASGQSGSCDVQGS